MADSRVRPGTERDKPKTSFLHQEVRENSKSNEAIVKVTRAGKKGPLQPTLSIRIRKG